MPHLPGQSLTIWITGHSVLVSLADILHVDVGELTGDEPGDLRASQYWRTPPPSTRWPPAGSARVIDDLLGPGRWQRPAHWGRPLVTFPHPDTAWDVHTTDWHLDSQDLELTMLAVFAHLAPVRPRGGGTLVITGSHRLTTPGGPQAGNAPVRSREVKTYLSYPAGARSLPGPGDSPHPDNAGRDGIAAARG